MANVLKAYVLYSATSLHVIPNSLMRRRHIPRIPNVIAVEVNASLCCDGEIPIVQSSPLAKGMKAYILYGSNGIPQTGPILRRKRPSGKGWRQIKFDLCCDTEFTFPVITSIQGTTETDAPEPAAFSVTFTGGGDIQWYVDDVAQVGETSTSFTIDPTVVGTYEITVTITNPAGEVTSEPIELIVS